MEAWYNGHKAKHLIDNIYYVWRGSWADPCYVVADKKYDVPVFGGHIEGQEVNYWDIWSDLNDNATPEEIRDEIMEVL